MTFLIGILAGLAFSFAGILKSQLLKNRVIQLEEAIVMIEKLQICLQYEKASTTEMITLLVESDSLSQMSFLQDCQKSMEQRIPFSQAWKRSIIKNSGRMSLLEDDRKTLQMLGDILGGSDAQSQQNGFEMVSGLLIQAVHQARDQVDEKGKFYRSMGVLGGIGMAILLL